VKNQAASEPGTRIFRPLALNRVTLPNRIIRSATYEGLADRDGYPRKDLGELYQRLSEDVALTVITGFVAVSRQGRAMHPGQGAIYDDKYIPAWRDVADAVRKQNRNSRLFMQLAHTGRQTLAKVTGQPVVGASNRRCTYFRQKVQAMTEAEIETSFADFAAAAKRARAAGFDGIQIHAAHGYLIHQFLSPDTNTRSDKWRDGGLFLMEVIKAVRREAGRDFPILLKVSCADDRALRPEMVINAVKTVENQLDAVEVSYGTMEWALNIFRGGCPLEAAFKINPRYKRMPKILRIFWKFFCCPRLKEHLKPYQAVYNLGGALTLKANLSVPIIPVGGFEKQADLTAAFDEYNFEAVSMSRPFICEPDLMSKLKKGAWSRSACSRCNLCAIYCDSTEPLRCYQTGRDR
jgi:2,4-dienoyl-CoA reductase-like NADH-dependent reductase (Old Yellow Enzyme family)